MKLSSLKKPVLTVMSIGLLAGASSAAFAGADCQAHPKNEWIPKQTMVQNLQKQGYRVKNFKVDDNCYEMYGYNQKNQKVEIYFDTKTGKVVKSELDD